MMAKHQISHNARNLIAYCLRVGYHSDKREKTKPRILLSNLCPATKNIKVLTAQIQGANEMRKTDRVHHLIFAHPNTDAEIVKKKGEANLIREVINGLKAKGINLDDTPYIVIAHYDKDNHIDYHLIAASTDLNGKPIKDSFIGSRAMYITNQISKKYGLTLNNEKNNKKKNEDVKQVKNIAAPIISIADEIKLADVEEIKVDNSNMTSAKSAGVTENIVMGGELIEKNREDKRRKEQEQQEIQRKKINTLNDIGNQLELSKEEREHLWIGYEIDYKKGRKVRGMTNDQDVILSVEEKADNISFVVKVGGVVKGILEWIKELGERILKRQQDDKTRTQSKQETQEREPNRGRGVKR